MDGGLVSKLELALDRPEDLRGVRLRDRDEHEEAGQHPHKCSRRRFDRSELVLKNEPRRLTPWQATGASYPSGRAPCAPSDAASRAQSHDSAGSDLDTSSPPQGLALAFLHTAVASVLDTSGAVRTRLAAPQGVVRAFLASDPQTSGRHGLAAPISGSLAGVT